MPAAAVLSGRAGAREETAVPEDISSWIEQNRQISVDNQNNLLYTIIVIVGLLLLRQIVNFLVRRRTDDAALIYRWRKATEYLALLLGAIALLLIWLPDATSFATYLGLLSAGLAIALQSPLVNLAGWAFILWRRPFSVGDRVQINEHRGDVIDQRIFMFSLLEIGNWVDADQSTGRVIHIPNGKVFTDVLANYAQGFHYIWNEIAVLVTFESDWVKAKEILQRIAANAAREKDPAGPEKDDGGGAPLLHKL